MDIRDEISLSKESSDVVTDKASRGDVCRDKASNGDYAEVFKNPIEISYFESSSDDENDGDGIDDDGGNNGDGIDEDDDDGGNGDADDDGKNGDGVGHVFSKEFDKMSSHSS
nr:hypothetical protein [Tanacetum cinerariifolium]